MITPGYLSKGDRIAVVAPAGKIDADTIDAACLVIESWGLEVVRGKHLFSNHYQYSAPDNERLSDLQEALDDAGIQAVLCARGGYGAIRMIDRLDFSNFKENPKWIIGFSDITVLHAHIHANLGVETIHGTMAAGVRDGGPARDSLRSVLFGENKPYATGTHPLSIRGRAHGRLTGGNLAILAGLLGSASDLQTDGKILFIEEVGEHLYRIDRMMWSLKRAGRLDRLAGLIAGSFTDIPDSAGDFGMDAYEIIHDHVKGYGYPVCFGFPAGHQADNRALIFGRTITLNIQDQTVITF